MLPRLGYLDLDFSQQTQEWALIHTITNDVVNIGKHSEVRLLYEDGFGVIHYCDDNVEEEATLNADELLKYGSTRAWTMSTSYRWRAMVGYEGEVAQGDAAGFDADHGSAAH